MSGSTELLVLRLAMIGVIFMFVLVAALVLRAGLQPRPARARVSQRAAPAGPRLIVVAPAETGLEPGAEFRLGPAMTIGRDEGNGILLGDPSVSGRHASLTRSSRGWVLMDLDSTNGTLVNGKRLDGRARVLSGGEQVVVGAVVFEFQA